MRNTTRALLILSSVLLSFYLSAQDLNSIQKARPFKLSGNIGASANFYTSNEPVLTQPPFAWSLYGNFNAEVYGVAIPLSFLVNQYGKSYSNPFAQFGLSPTYKWARLHLGYRTLFFSPLTFEGQSFRGAGLELNPGLLRFAAFYGKLNRAVNEDTTAARFRMPQYSRNAYGIKLGIGKASSYFDLMYFHAKDDSLSATVINKLSHPRPQENAVLGTSFRVALLKRLVISGDMALSGLTLDQAYTNKGDSTSGLSRIVNKFFSTNASTIADWAGQTQVAASFPGITTTVGYRRVQPDFKSLGTNYMVSDVELISLSNAFMLAKGKLNVNLGLATQHNNLGKRLGSELKTGSANLNMNAFLSNRLSVNLNASGYRMRQENGTIVISDSIRLRQNITQVNLAPVYSVVSGVNVYSFSANLGYGWLKDLNTITAPSSENNTFNASLSAGKYFSVQSLNLTLTGLYNRYQQAAGIYTSVGGNLSVATQLLKDKALGLQSSVGILANRFTGGEAKQNMTFSLNANYRAGRHAFMAFANYVYTPPSTISQVNKVPYAVFSHNLGGGINYVYSF